MNISPAALSATPRRANVFEAPVTFYSLTIGDIMEWDCWAQGQFRRGTRFGMTDGTPDEQLSYRILSNDEAKLICFGSAHGREVEWSFTGCLYVAWLSLRHGNPKLTFDETAKLFGFGRMSIPDQRRAAEVAKIEIHIASGMLAEEVALGLTKPKKNESQTAESESPSPTPPTGSNSSDISGPSTNATQPG